MQLESLPKIKRLPQSDITSDLVRQLTCLLNHEIKHKLINVIRMLLLLFRRQAYCSFRSMDIGIDRNVPVKERLT